jgi:imidazolonepropionase-like amidohydrolase
MTKEFEYLQRQPNPVFSDARFTQKLELILKTMRFTAFLALIALLMVSFQSTAQAQSRLDVYAITGARIVVGNGTVIERGTVVVRKGLIEAVGASVSAPADAKVIDGTGLTIYPGLIDAHSNIGMPTSQARPAGPGQGGMQQASTSPASNSNFPTGLQPEKDAFSDLRGGDAQFEAARNAGITSALTVGRDGIFNGQSVLINMAGESVSAMVLKDRVAQHFSFRTIGGGVYPTSLLGTFSAFRQMLLDARRHAAMVRAYEANPRGLQRPPADRSIEALVPVVNGTMPIAFNAVTENEINRALGLIEEFKLNGMIVGGHEAWKTATRLKRSNVPVIFSLNLPKRTTAAAPEADAESLRTLRNRTETPKAPGILAKEGVKVVFTSGGLTNLNDFLANVAKVVEGGLSKEAAIRALTLGAAELFGVSDKLGTVETGKIANLIAVKGDIFPSDRFINHIFVDGRHFEQKERPRPQGQGGQQQPAASTASVAGAWAVSIDVPGSPLSGTLTLNQQGNALTGTLQTQLGPAAIKTGSVTGDSFTFTASVEFGGASIDITANGRVSGAQVSGTIDSPQGSVPFSGRRNP